MRVASPLWQTPCPNNELTATLAGIDHTLFGNISLHFVVVANFRLLTKISHCLTPRLTMTVRPISMPGNRQQVRIFVSKRIEDRFLVL